mmetsp:Transcript_30093/g.39620  ORF Transcript_30093/g.39620 Transcript_30093/m.39620 type:complete len:465 (+) Transcript_30093:54-1448(+)|eukprot:CAMPEP_0117789522 /NCGR_PEP_ID=MMETSP0948-20121206/7685_1 /TAXON_ID=44440 /ORGANISM="Chattonella subsalsa, Strain CCMP2191" /LENGTH=464 /DNA_ID=CAMNT_0005619147 /DNA_START=50 /DNA_END=1444 /DNA_ORIENTATION=-
MRRMVGYNNNGLKTQQHSFMISDESSKKVCRSLPRRRKEANDEPIFIRKTYEMISACDINVACWTDDGKSFFVKNPDRMATDIIPQYFKHNKFSSFVRQLNFYGFRKVKSAQTVLIGNIPSEWWEFHHPKFQRGNPGMLCQIKRASHYENKPEILSDVRKDHEEISNLRNEVVQLKTALKSVTNELSELKEIVGSLMKESEGSASSISPNKKRRVPNEAIESASIKVESDLFSALDPSSTIKKEILEPKTTEKPVIINQNQKVCRSASSKVEILQSCQESENSNSNMMPRANSFMSVISDFDPNDDLITDLIEMELGTSDSPGRAFGLLKEACSPADDNDDWESVCSSQAYPADNLADSIPDPIEIKQTLVPHQEKHLDLPQVFKYVDSVVKNCDLNQILKSLNLTKSGSPPLAPAAVPLASAALGAFFTKLASQYSRQMIVNNSNTFSNTSLQAAFPLCAASA